MSILTASESNAFMSFLSSMDYGNNADEYLTPEWDLYTANTDLIIQASGKEALAQATKNLMSLDALATGKISRPDLQLHHLSSSSSTSPYKHPMQYPLTLRTTVDPAAFSYSSRSPPPADDVPSYASSSVSSTDSAPSPSTPTESLSPPTFPSPRTSFKRAAPATAPSSNKRARPALNATASSSSSGSGSGSKPALLSATQKKANHIQSEQKRRANIRRGYEALCDAVPSLREGSASASWSDQADSQSKTRKRRASAGAADASNATGSDGRAGPRSENVVLQKSIDYIQDLIAEQAALMARLSVARTRASGHPLLEARSCTGTPAWEREWTGGKKHIKEEDDEEDD